MVKGVLIIEGHVQGLSNARSAAELNLPVWVMHNGNCITSSSTSCQKFIHCNPYDSEDFIHDLIKLGTDKHSVQTSKYLNKSSIKVLLWHLQ